MSVTVALRDSVLESEKVAEVVFDGVRLPEAESVSVLVPSVLDLVIDSETVLDRDLLSLKVSVAVDDVDSERVGVCDCVEVAEEVSDLDSLSDVVALGVLLRLTEFERVAVTVGLRESVLESE